jgi:hypothetical protein
VGAQVQAMDKMEASRFGRQVAAAKQTLLRRSTMRALKRSGSLPHSHCATSTRTP